MCGIAGVAGPGAQADVVSQMLATIAHRGEEAYRAEIGAGDGFAVGTNRLAIVDEPAGRQPFRSPDGRVVCVVNGEIYNHRELRRDLSDRYVFRTGCDAEIVLAAYLAWGQAMWDRLRGMYGVAVWDAVAGLTLARDPLGIKPLYLSRVGEQVIFGSELKAFDNVPGIRVVEELEPGHVWHGGVARAYWTCPEFATAGTPDLAALDEALRDAVSSHLPDLSTPVACLLSGGVDSSTILALADELHPAGAEAWTFAAADTDSDDLTAARTVCRHLGVPLRVVSPPADQLQRLYLREGVWLAETWEPPLVRNAVSYHVLCRAVRAGGHKLCLSGEGADEVFGGYDYFRQLPVSGRDEAVHASLRSIYRTYLQMADRASMYATLEVRVPYVDRRFVTAAAALPPTARFDGDTNKAALRRLYPELLPPSIRFRAKSGMNAGAGFGGNDPGDGIYSRAVIGHYAAHPALAEADRGIAIEHGGPHGVDTDDAEETYNFARYVERGFHRLTVRERPQLNVARLRPEPAGRR